MNLTFRENYWDSPELKAQFLSFLHLTFGLDLTLWNSSGFWDQAYRPFSFFDADSLVSNVCVYSMDMTVHGKRCKVAQVSAVGTRPEYRRQGLSLKLTQTALDWARNHHDFFYLFADESAYLFYKQCGFRIAEEFKPRAPVMGRAAREGAVKLNMQLPGDIELAFRVASGRAPVSNILGVSNTKLFMFWCLYALKDHIYYLSAHDLLVLYKRTGRTVQIFDIVGTSVPSFAELYPYISDPLDDTVEFLFMADKMRLTNDYLVKVEGNGAHVHGNFPLENTPFIFPFTSQA